MKKLLLLMTIVCSLESVHSQEIYFYTGKIIPIMILKMLLGFSPDLQAGSGTFYETGYAMSLNNEKLNMLLV
jgi:hypothetical protein